MVGSPTRGRGPPRPAHRDPACAPRRGRRAAAPNASSPKLQCSPGVSQTSSAQRPSARTSSSAPRGGAARRRRVRRSRRVIGTHELRRVSAPARAASVPPTRQHGRSADAVGASRELERPGATRQSPSSPSVRDFVALVDELLAWWRRSSPGRSRRARCPRRPSSTCRRCAPGTRTAVLRACRTRRVLATASECQSSPGVGEVHAVHRVDRRRARPTPPTTDRASR